MYLLGIDIGTTSMKTALFDRELQRLSSSVVDYSVEVHGDFVEFDAEAYWSMVKDAVKAHPASSLNAMAIDTQCETLILADENGIPLRKAIVWLDNRATEEAAELEQHFGKQQVYEVTGQPEITATWPACKLLWVKKHEPDIWAKTKKIFLLEDFLLYRLTGSFAAEKTLQSSTLYFDIRRGTWWQEMLDYLGIDVSMLPRLYESGECVGAYNGVPVVTSAMDQIAGAIGAGVLDSRTVSEMTGTTMALLTPCDEIPAYHENSIVPCHYFYNGGYCLLSWSPTAGMALKWFKNAFCETQSFAELDALASPIPPGCDGLVFLPYLCGSTMPKYNPAARGSFTGITPEHTKGHFVRSIMESVSYMLRENLEFLNPGITEIRAMGGGANSALWCQMKADVTHCTLLTLDEKETACLGSAILAGVGVGMFSAVEQACAHIAVQKRYVPQNTDYTEAYERYRKMDRVLNV